MYLCRKKKSTSTPELQPYQRSAKSMLRSVSFRDEQLNVPLNDFNVTVDSGGDSSAQWIPNRQRVEAGQSRSPEVNLSISVVSEADGAAQWIPNRERTVRVENDSPAVADFGGSYIETKPRDGGIRDSERLMLRHITLTASNSSILLSFFI